MRRGVLLLALAAACAVPASAAKRPNHKKRILQQARRMFAAFKAGDLEGFLDLTMPEVVKELGGRKATKAKMKPGLAELNSQIESQELGEPTNAVSDKDELAAYVPVVTVYRFPKGRVRQESFLVAASADDGMNWTFMSAQCKPKQVEFIRERFPALAAGEKQPPCGSTDLAEAK